MKPAIILMAAMAVSPLSSKANELCDHMATLATSIMTAHQSSVPLSTAMGIALKGGDEQVNKVTKQIVMDAYGSPRFHTDKAKMRAVSDFRDKRHLACLKAFM